jgi:hypothetical protein
MNPTRNLDSIDQFLNYFSYHLRSSRNYLEYLILMKMFTLKIIYSFLLICLFTEVRAQSLVEDANLNSEVSSENVFNENIKIISNSKKIFILSNNNQQLMPGDYISLALDNNLAARAVVGKVHQGQVGIKILKIYSLAQWSKLKRDLEVQVIRGDDSRFGKKPEAAPAEEGSIAKIASEEDLYTGDVVISDDLEIIDENKNRHIKPDNVVSVYGAFLDANEVASRGGTARATQLGVGWAFQFSDNYFAEALYGRAIFDGFPADGIQTLVNHVVGRVKFNIKGPLYIFFMPYIGYQSYTITSPDAGKDPTPASATANNEELDAIDELKRSGPVVGVTVLRRLVPGWFIKADIGTDVVNVGFAIEF